MMTDLGFTYIPSTAGSRVRFDPPNPKDRVGASAYPPSRAKLIYICL